MSTQPRLETPENFFLSGNYAPVREEHVETDLEVIGELPRDLDGFFLRIGPNPAFVPNVETYHVFDGDGMIHQVEFGDGRATYRNRFVQSEGFLKEREKGSWIWKGMVFFGLALILCYWPAPQRGSVTVRAPARAKAPAGGSAVPSGASAKAAPRKE